MRVDAGGIGVGVKAIPMLVPETHLVMRYSRSRSMLVDGQPQIVPDTLSVEFHTLPLPSVCAGVRVGSGMIPEL